MKKLFLIMMCAVLFSCSKELGEVEKTRCAKVYCLSFKYGLDTTAAPLKIDTLNAGNSFISCGSELTWIEKNLTAWTDFSACGYYFKWEKTYYSIVKVFYN
jgi:hypothetical protein